MSSIFHRFIFPYPLDLDVANAQARSQHLHALDPFRLIASRSLSFLPFATPFLNPSPAAGYRPSRRCSASHSLYLPTPLDSLSPSAVTATFPSDSAPFHACPLSAAPMPPASVGDGCGGARVCSRRSARRHPFGRCPFRCRSDPAFPCEIVDREHCEASCHAAKQSCE